MRTVSELEKSKNKQYIVSMHVGESGSGKTHCASTYPKCYFIITEPNSHQTWMNNGNKGNIVAYEYFIPETKTFKDMFIRIDKELDTAKAMFVEGKVDTLVIDNLTYLVHNRWLWMNKFMPIKTRTGEVDTRGMYGQLRTWCYEFMLTQILSFPGNIVCNLHIMQEGDEALEKKVDKTLVYTCNLLGGFRNDIDGLFSNVFFLSKKRGKEGGYKYYCRTNKGEGKLGKNRFNLPEILENVSYDVIQQAINKGGKV